MMRRAQDPPPHVVSRVYGKYCPVLSVPASSGTAEIRVAPFFAVLLSEAGLASTPVATGWNTVDVLDLTFDVVAFWSFRYHRKKPTEADILAGAVFLLTRAQ